MDAIEKFNIIRVFDTDAFERNAGRAKSATSARLGISAKGDMYGFGLGRAASAIRRQGARDIFMQTLNEAIAAREIFKDENIYAYDGVQEGQAEEFARIGAIPACASLAQLEYLNSRAKGARAAIHFDTGMNRTGLSREEAGALSQNWKKFAGRLEIALYLSHLHGPIGDKKITGGQLALLREILGILPRAEASLSASGGLMNLPREYHFDVVRPGCALIGAGAGMEQPLSVYAKILQIREVAKGATIGYSD